MTADSESTQLPYLETFSKAAELGSFTAAAKALRLSQAAASQRIQVLERTLDTNLFERKGGHAALTEAGKKLYGYAQQILTLHGEARRAITGMELPCGTLAIAASSVPGDYLLPSLISRFGQRHARIHVRARVSDSMDVMWQVEHGDVCLGLVGRDSDSANLEFLRIACDQMVLVALPNHALCRRKSANLSELSEYPLILRCAGSGLRHCFETAIAAAGWKLGDFQVVLELGSNEAVKSAVRQGAGLAILSSFAVRKEVESGELRALHIRGLKSSRGIFVVKDKRRVLPAEGRLFLSFLESPHPSLGRRP